MCSLFSTVGRTRSDRRFRTSWLDFASHDPCLTDFLFLCPQSFAKDLKTGISTSFFSPNLPNYHHSNFIENGPRHPAVSSPKPSRLVRDYHLFNNSCLCISRIYAVFKELKKPLALRSVRGLYISSLKSVWNHSK